MLCAIYRSPKRDQTYLYIEKKDDFSRVPAELLASFGKPQFAMLLSLNERKSLATADIEKVKSALVEQGFYLQVPPPPESLLKMHLVKRKLSSLTVCGFIKEHVDEIVNDYSRFCGCYIFGVC